MKFNKTANIEDIGTVIEWLAFFIIGFIISYKLLKAFADNLVSIPAVPDFVKTFVTNWVISYPGWIDNGITFLLFMLCLFSIFMARKLPSDPIYYIISVIIAILLSGSAILISFIYHAIIINPQFIGLELFIPKLNYIMENLVYFVIAYWFGVVWALYGKK
jgi:hypothetical protein